MDSRQPADPEPSHTPSGPPADSGSIRWRVLLFTQNPRQDLTIREQRVIARGLIIFLVGIVFLLFVSMLLLVRSWAVAGEFWRVANWETRLIFLTPLLIVFLKLPRIARYLRTSWQGAATDEAFRRMRADEEAAPEAVAARLIREGWRRGGRERRAIIRSVGLKLAVSLALGLLYYWFIVRRS